MARERNLISTIKNSNKRFSKKQNELAINHFERMANALSSEEFRVKSVLCEPSIQEQLMPLQFINCLLYIRPH